MPLNRVFVVGIGMTPFTKPKKDVAEGPHYPELAEVAVARALADACIDKAEIQQAFVGVRRVLCSRDRNRNRNRLVVGWPAANEISFFFPSSLFHSPRIHSGHSVVFLPQPGTYLAHSFSPLSLHKNMFANGAGQRSLYPMGITEIPIHNVHNACATGSNALYLARQAVMSGMYDCCLALGVEKMK